MADCQRHMHPGGRTNSIQLIYEDNSWCPLASFCEKITNARSAPPNKELHKLTGSRCKEGHVRLSSYCPGCETQSYNTPVRLRKQLRDASGREAGKEHQQC